MSDADMLDRYGDLMLRYYNFGMRGDLEDMMAVGELIAPPRDMEKDLFSKEVVRSWIDFDFRDAAKTIQMISKSIRDGSIKGRVWVVVKPSKVSIQWFTELEEDSVTIGIIMGSMVDGT